MLKRILVGFVAVLALLAVIGLLLPRNIHVQRSITIARPASLVYATVSMVRQRQSRLGHSGHYGVDSGPIGRL